MFGCDDLIINEGNVRDYIGIIEVYPNILMCCNGELNDEN